MAALTLPTSGGLPHASEVRLIDSEVPPCWGAAEALALTTYMQRRLREAVCWLLRQPGLNGAPATVRLATVVLMARTPSGCGLMDKDTAVVRLRVPELGRWVGVQSSTVSREVRPGLSVRGIAESWDEFAPGTRRIVGVRWRLTAVRDARRTAPADHPLRLTKREFAVLFRLVEAVLAPGWHHRDGRRTHPGLLGERTGQHAAADRLALLLAVLDARPTGEVRLCAGAVDRHGRLPATLARLTCGETGENASALARLLEAGVVELRERAGQVRLMIGDVADAHRGLRAARRAGGRPAGVSKRRRGDCRCAGQDQKAPISQKPQVREGAVSHLRDRDSAALHTVHTPKADESRESARDQCVSGEAVLGDRPLPDRVRAREDQHDHGDQCQPSASDVVRGALRAEPRVPSPHSVTAPSSTGWVEPWLEPRVPQVVGVLASIIPSPTAFQRARLSDLVRGLLGAGEDDAVIRTRLVERLRRLATGDPNVPYRFRRDGFSWALWRGLPYKPGELTPLPCTQRGCPNLSEGPPGGRVRCNDCNLAAHERQEGARARRAIMAALAAPLPPPAPRGEDQPAVMPQIGPAPGADVPVGLPGPVQTQLAALVKLSPADARVAENAAWAAYRPVCPEESEERHRRRVSAGYAAWCAVTQRHARALASP